MFISFRAAKVRNLSVASVNGSVTLIILLIAPLGLAAVIINTLLVAVASYGVGQMADRVILWLSPPPSLTTISPKPYGVANSKEIAKRQP